MSAKRHDLALILDAKKITMPQAEAIATDLQAVNNQFYCRIKKSEESAEERVIFVGFEEEKMILDEAQRLQLLKNKKSKDAAKEEERNKARKEQEGYLHKRILQAEKKKPFDVRRHLF